MSQPELETGVHDQLANAEYHRLPALSTSGAKLLLPPSCPAMFRFRQDHPDYKIDYDWGNAAHKVVLSDVSAEVEVLDFPDRRAKGYKAAETAARDAGRTPMLAKDWAEVEAMAEAIKAHPLAAALLDPAGGQPEQSIIWADDQTGITRKARIDWLRHQRRGRLIIVDYKTTAKGGAERSKFSRTAMDFKYHLQAAWYADGVKAVGLDPDPAFLFVVQERTRPYLVNVIELDPDDVKIGRHLGRQAIDLYVECVAADRWPTYSDDVQLVQLPVWYRRDYEDVIL